MTTTNKEKAMPNNIEDIKGIILDLQKKRDMMTTERERQNFAYDIRMDEIRIQIKRLQCQINLWNASSKAPSESKPYYAFYGDPKLPKDAAKRMLQAAVEDLADIEHQRWSHWQRYLHSKGTPQPDGSLLLPTDQVSKWTRQMSTTYADLSEKEKESDREQVRLVLPTIVAAITRS